MKQSEKLQDSSGLKCTFMSSLNSNLLLRIKLGCRSLSACNSPSFELIIGNTGLFCSHLRGTEERTTSIICTKHGTIYLSAHLRIIVRYQRNNQYERDQKRSVFFQTQIMSKALLKFSSRINAKQLRPYELEHSNLFLVAKCVGFLPPPASADDADSLE
jgi:hypothetical protein